MRILMLRRVNSKLPERWQLTVILVAMVRITATRSLRGALSLAASRVALASSVSFFGLVFRYEKKRTAALEIVANELGLRFFLTRMSGYWRNCNDFDFSIGT